MSARFRSPRSRPCYTAPTAHENTRRSGLEGDDGRREGLPGAYHSVHSLGLAVCPGAAADNDLGHVHDLLALALLGVIPHRPDAFWVGGIADEKVGRGTVVSFCR